MELKVIIVIIVGMKEEIIPKMNKILETENLDGDRPLLKTLLEIQDYVLLHLVICRPTMRSQNFVLEILTEKQNPKNADRNGLFITNTGQVILQFCKYKTAQQYGFLQFFTSDEQSTLLKQFINIRKWFFPHPSNPTHNYLFVDNNVKPLQQVGRYFKRIMIKLINMNISIGTIRKIMESTIAESKLFDSNIHNSLSAAMLHDPQTAKRYYISKNVETYSNEINSHWDKFINVMKSKGSILTVPSTKLILSSFDNNLSKNNNDNNNNNFKNNNNKSINFYNNNNNDNSYNNNNNYYYPDNVIEDEFHSYDDDTENNYMVFTPRLSHQLSPSPQSPQFSPEFSPEYSPPNSIPSPPRYSPTLSLYSPQPCYIPPPPPTYTSHSPSFSPYHRNYNNGDLGNNNNIYSEVEDPNHYFNRTYSPSIRSFRTNYLQSPPPFNSNIGVNNNYVTPTPPNSRPYFRPYPSSPPVNKQPGLKEMLGDWVCTRCGNLNFQRRLFCRACGLSKYNM